VSTTPLIFQLGAERSGSTWLANIFDAHPGVELFMEPLADFAGLFPQVAERNTWASDRLEEPLESCYRRLRRAKYPFLYRPGRPIWIKLIEERAAVAAVRLSARHLGQVPALIRNYRLLNLNSANLPLKARSRKASRREAVVVKELRLNFKVGSLARTAPGASYLIAVRDPGAQLSSALRLLRGGRLGELRRSLPGLAEAVQHVPRFAAYRHLPSMLRGPGDLEGRLILWWVLNYDVMLQDARTFGIRYRVVHHEVIANSPIDVAPDLFHWCGLDYPEKVRHYVALSSSTPAVGPAPLDTNRDSAAFVRESLAQVDSTLSHRIQGVLETVDLAPELDRYRKQARGSVECG
jgi:hypothetical protein